MRKFSLAGYFFILSMSILVGSKYFITATWQIWAIALGLLMIEIGILWHSFMTLTSQIQPFENKKIL